MTDFLSVGSARSVKVWTINQALYFVFGVTLGVLLGNCITIIPSIMWSVAYFYPKCSYRYIWQRRSLFSAGISNRNKDAPGIELNLRAGWINYFPCRSIQIFRPHTEQCRKYKMQLPRPQNSISLIQCTHQTKQHELCAYHILSYVNTLTMALIAKRGKIFMRFSLSIASFDLRSTG